MTQTLPSDSSLVGSGHPDKYSYEIPHKHLSEWGNLSGKIISSNVITSLIWDFLFSNGDFTTYIFSEFSRTAIFSWKQLLHTSLE